MNRIALGLLALLAAGSAQALTPAEVFELRSPSVYAVIAADKEGRRLGGGSGVVIGPEQMVTSCQVLAGASEIAVRRGNVSYGARLEWPDPERDLCQLKVPELKAPAAPLNAAGLKVGQRVYAIGAEHRAQLALAEGMVSALRQAEGGKAALPQISARLPEGASGGGLFDEAGRLVGITTLDFRGQPFNGALPVDWVRELPERGMQVLAKRRQSAPRAAAGQAPAPRPDAGLPGGMPQVGDSWTYVVVDRMFRPQDRSRKFVHTVRAVNRASIVEGVTHNGAEIGQTVFVADTTAVYRPKAEIVEVAPFITAFNKPLKPGDTWQWIQVRGLDALAVGAATGETPYSFERGRIVGSERVSVPAGTFDAIRVEFDGRVSSVLLNMSASIRGYMSFRQTVWYAPQAKRAVRLLMEAQGVATAYELESYTLR